VIPDEEAQNLAPESWADESFKISESFVYAAVKENGSVSATYEEQGQQIAERTIVVAGHRLANLLQSINLDKYASIEKFLA